MCISGHIQTRIQDIEFDAGICTEITIKIAAHHLIIKINTKMMDDRGVVVY